MVCFHGRSIVRRPYHVRVLLELPSAQSPFARARCYLARRGLLNPVSRCYPAIIAPTDSCANPPPSSCLGATLGHQVCAGCGQPLLGRGPSRRYLCTSFPACLDLYPGGSCGASARFFPHDSGLPPVRTGSALHHVRPATSVRRPFRGCSHFFLFRPAGLLTTQVAPTATVSAVGQPWFLRPSLSRFVTSPCPGYANRLNRAIDGMGTCTPLDAQPCRLLPRTPGLSRARKLERRRDVGCRASAAGGGSAPHGTLTDVPPLCDTRHLTGSRGLLARAETEPP